MRCHLWVNVKNVMGEIFKLVSVVVVIMVNHCFIDKLRMNFSFYSVVIFRVDVWILWMPMMTMIMLVMVFDMMNFSMMTSMMMFSIVDLLEIFTFKFFMICSMVSSKNLFKVLMFYLMFLMMLSMWLFQMLTVMHLMSTKNFLKMLVFYMMSWM